MPSSDRPLPDTYVEPDCIHWPPGALDLEPEQCWCLRCGEALPCPCAPHSANSTKELILDA